MNCGKAAAATALALFAGVSVLLSAVAARAWTPNAKDEARLARGEVAVEVAPDPGRSSGLIHAAVDVPAAAADKVWAIILDCAQAPRLLRFVKTCRVVEADPASAWDVREQTIDYGFLLPPVRIRFRSDYEAQRRIEFHCVAGSQVKVCDGEWRLEPGPGGTVRVIYDTAILSPYPVPAFLARGILGADIARGLRALRREATGGP